MALELNEADEKVWKEYRRLGTPEDIRSKRSDLEEDNAKYREKLRLKERELEDAKKPLPEGSVVINAEEAKTLAAYKALGKPEDLKKLGEDKVALEKKVAASEQQEAAEAAAAAAGFRPEVLRKLPGAAELKFEVRKEKVDGEDAEIAYVTEAKQGAIPQKLTDYVEATWREFLPALTAEDEEGDKEEVAPRSPDNTRAFPPLKSKGSARKGRTEEDFRAATEKTARYSL